jgi:hypothetical protein
MVKNKFLVVDSIFTMQIISILFYVMESAPGSFLILAPPLTSGGVLFWGKENFV